MPEIRSCRRGLALAASLLTLAGPVAPAGAAAPVIDLHWNACTGPIDRDAGAGPVQSLFVSETGLVDPTQAFQVDLRFRSLGGGLGDAWRFDDAGCQAQRFGIVLTSTDTRCPAIPFVAPLTIAKFLYTTSGVQGTGHFLLAVAGNAPAAPASGRNFLARIDFDESAGRLGPGSTAQTCGCLDRPMCIELLSGIYLDPLNQEQPFTLGQSYVTWNDPGNSTYCGGVIDCWPSGVCQFDSTCVAPVAAHARSWGFVKNVYRAPAR